MALIDCPECRKEVSTSAKSCPHCGYVMRTESILGGARRFSTPGEKKEKPEELGPLGTCGCLVWGVVAIGLIFGMVSMGGRQQPEGSYFLPLTVTGFIAWIVIGILILYFVGNKTDD